MIADAARIPARVLVAAAFALAGALKLSDPAGFAIDIGSYRLVPPFAAAALALYLPRLGLALAVEAPGTGAATVF